MEVARPIKQKGYVQLIKEISQPALRMPSFINDKGKEVEGEVIANFGKYPLEDIETIRNQVSARLKYQYPDRKYSVNKMADFTMVYWERRSESCKV